MSEFNEGDVVLYTSPNTLAKTWVGLVLQDVPGVNLKDLVVIKLWDIKNSTWFDSNYRIGSQYLTLLGRLPDDCYE